MICSTFSLPTGKIGTKGKSMSSPCYLQVIHIFLQEKKKIPTNTFMLNVCIGENVEESIGTKLERK